MIKILAGFQDNKDQNHLAFVTNRTNGVWSRCIHAIFHERKNQWFVSWTKLNTMQLKQSMKNNNVKVLNLRADIPEELKPLIQQTIDNLNKRIGNV